MGRGRRGGGGDREDQYGGFGSQDKDNFQSFSSRGGRGGGSAGSATRHKGGDLSFQRHVPKFLQPYAHMLGRGARQGGNEDGGDEDAPVVVGAKRGAAEGGFDGWEDDDRAGGGREEDIEADALKRAMEENPELAKEFEGKLEKKLNQARAVEEKEKGNKAFSDKKYQVAIEHFTKAIELDAESEVYYSNRSAAHAALEQWEEAAKDARKAVQLRPNWAKAYSRLGAALYGLKLYGDAKEAYARAVKLEPDDQALQRALEKAEGMEMQHIRDKKHVFFSKKAKLGEGDAPGRSGGGREAAADAGAGSSRAGQREAAGSQGKGAGGSKDGSKGQPRPGGTLSFADDEDG